MPTPTGNLPPQVQMHGHDDDIVDWQLVWNYLRFVAGAPLRHPILAGSMFVAAVAAAVLSIYALPKTYETEMRLLAERSKVIPTLSNPGVGVPEDDPFVRATDEIILRRDSLTAIIEETNLAEEWGKSRAPAQRLFDWIRGVISRPPTPEERTDMLVGTLEKRLRVRSESTGTLTIRVRWPQPEMAARIVESAYRNFLESRHTNEVAVIEESIAILETHAARARADAQEAAEALRNTPGIRTSRRSEPRRPAAAGEPATEDPGVTDLRASLVATRHTIDDLEDARRRRIAELQVELVQQLSTYGPSHPALLNTQERLRLLSSESPQVTALKRKERELQATLPRQAGRGAESARSERVALGAVKPALADQRAESTVDSDTADQARRRLINVLDRRDSLDGRIESARMELDIARAAFKYRYSVLRPAQVPRGPVAPSVPLTMAVGLVAGIVLGFAASTGRDVLGGRIVEPWQIERQFDLPVITTMQAPR